MRMKDFTIEDKKAIVDRFFIATNELPHSIEYKGMNFEDNKGYFSFLCESANHKKVVGMNISAKGSGNVFLHS